MGLTAVMSVANSELYSRTRWFDEDASGFDIELQMRGRWFLAAINLLNDHDLLASESLSVKRRSSTCATVALE
jgi:hypothetical protein